MPSERQQLGRRGEAQAVAFLKKSGYEILECNYRNRLGEIDIIAKDQETLAFIEVKSKKKGIPIHPKYALTRQKQKKISRVALLYLKTLCRSGCKARFDVVTLITESSPPEIELIKNAFELAYP